MQRVTSRAILNSGAGTRKHNYEKLEGVWDNCYYPVSVYYRQGPSLKECDFHEMLMQHAAVELPWC